MFETRITEGIRLNIIKLKNIQLFIDKLNRQPEFEAHQLARMQVASLHEALKYSDTLLKQLYQKAVAYGLKTDRIIPKKEA